MTQANDPVSPLHMRQTGEIDYRPATAKEVEQDYCIHMLGGLTKREYFAAMAMQGLLHGAHAMGFHHETTAKRAVEMADYLITQLNQQP